MRIVYFGTSAFAVPALERLASETALVVTQPDRPAGRGMESRPSEVKSAALALGLPVETPEKSRDKTFVESLKALDPDAFVVASYGQILSRSLLAVPRHGAVNLHASILPKYRGAAPIQYAVLNGDERTGVTVMMMDEGMDTGDIVAVSELRIAPDETAGQLHDRLAELAGEMAGEWIPRIVAEEYPRQPQDGSKASYAPKVTKADAQLSFERDARKEYDRFRAFTPVPGAWMDTSLGSLKVKSARLPARAIERAVAQGTVVSVRPFEVAFAEGSLVFETVQAEGKRAVSGEDYANGARIVPGDCLLR